MGTKQLRIWRSEFGQKWTDRNIVSPALRVKAFEKIIKGLELESVLEVGCGSGHNLVTLSWLGNYRLVGIDPQEYAVRQAKAHNVEAVLGDCFHIPFKDKVFDLVFTCGVLMHVSLEDLAQAAQELWRVCRKYVLVIEYFSRQEESIHYHGFDDLLFKRDYSKLLPNCIEQGFLGKEDGFDNCNWWLFSKENE